MKNKYAIVAVVVLIVLSLVVVFGMNRSNSADGDQTEQVLQTEEEIADVDSSVLVSLEPLTGGREVVITVENPPTGTELISYQITYEEETKGPQGAIGEVDLDTLEAEVTLGTCSSGTCVYHDVVGDVELLLTFEGEYGKQKFEKKYSLSSE